MSTPKGRGPNKYIYKFHIHGTLNGVSIDEKYTSINQFLVKWGGTATPLKLNRQKLTRLRAGYYDGRSKGGSKLVEAMWGLTIDEIREPRPFKRTTVKMLLDESTIPQDKPDDMVVDYDEMIISDSPTPDHMVFEEYYVDP